MTVLLERPTIKQIPVTIDRDSPIPLYHQVAEQLARAIESGFLQPGDVFENEVSLAERLDMSRPTVRRSIGELVTRGLLMRRRGVGTIVAQPTVHRHNELTSLYDDLAGAGHNPSSRVLRLDRGHRDKDAALALGVAPGTPLVYIERLRLIDGEPLAILRNWLAPSCGNVTASELESIGLYDLLRRRSVAPAVARQSVGSRAASAEERRLLELGRFDPVLTMTRRAYDSSGAPIEFGDHCYRSDRYRFNVTVHAC